MTTTNTIKFNVGGKHFEVSRDLMEKHSETMLGKLVSEAWQQDPEEPVFIDRDGDIFAHVLNYLRYGSIELPPSVPRSSFERDLDFYGLVPNEGDIKEKSFDMIASLRQDRDNAESHLKTAQSKYEMSVLAAEVYHQYLLKKENTKDIVLIQRDKIRSNECLRDRLENRKCDTLSKTEEGIFLNYLDVHFGLRMATSEDFKNEGSRFRSSSSYITPSLGNHGYFHVTRK